MSKLSLSLSDYPTGIIDDKDYYGDTTYVPTETQVVKAIRVAKIHRWVFRVFVIVAIIAGIWALINLVPAALLVDIGRQTLWLASIVVPVVTVIWYLVVVCDSRDTLKIAKKRGVKKDD